MLVRSLALPVCNMEHCPLKWAKQTRASFHKKCLSSAANNKAGIFSTPLAARSIRCSLHCSLCHFPRGNASQNSVQRFNVLWLDGRPSILPFSIRVSLSLHKNIFNVTYKASILKHRSFRRRFKAESSSAGCIVILARETIAHKAFLPTRINEWLRLMLL